VGGRSKNHYTAVKREALTKLKGGGIRGDGRKMKKRRKGEEELRMAARSKGRVRKDSIWQPLKGNE